MSYSCFSVLSNIIDWQPNWSNSYFLQMHRPKACLIKTPRSENYYFKYLPIVGAAVVMESMTGLTSKIKRTQI